MQFSIENNENHNEDIPIFEYSDKKIYEDPKNRFSLKAVKIISSLSIVTQVALFIYSITLNSRQTYSTVSVAQWVMCALAIIITSFILILSATNKWKSFIEFVFKHNLNGHMARSEQEILDDINQENALRVFENYITITKNGLTKTYPLENIMTVDINKERHSFTLKFIFKSGIKREFNTPIPMQFFDEISSIFEVLITKEKNVSTSLPDEISPRIDWPFIIIGVIFGTVSIVLTILSTQGYINFPLYLGIFFISVSFMGVLASLFNNFEKGRLLFLPLISGLMFFAISISFIIAIFDVCKTTDFLIALQNAPIIIFIVPFIFIGILFIITGVHNIFKNFSSPSPKM